MAHTYKNCVPPRLGKTKREHKNGTWARRFDNASIRAAWQQDRASTTANFPYHVCNGKRNKHSVSKKAKPAHA